ncbi:MAG: hypothetical protein M1514_02900 [Patescibacteria group bacterium]|nr:hypothetical protein [Patescibacteria group bacterium]
MSERFKPTVEILDDGFQQLSEVLYPEDRYRFADLLTPESQEAFFRELDEWAFSNNQEQPRMAARAEIFAHRRKLKWVEGLAYIPKTLCSLNEEHPGCRFMVIGSSAENIWQGEPIGARNKDGDFLVWLGPGEYFDFYSEFNKTKGRFLLAEQDGPRFRRKRSAKHGLPMIRQVNQDAAPVEIFFPLNAQGDRSPYYPVLGQILGAPADRPIPVYLATCGEEIMGVPLDIFEVYTPEGRARRRDYQGTYLRSDGIKSWEVNRSFKVAGQPYPELTFYKSYNCLGALTRYAFFWPKAMYRQGMVMVANLQELATKDFCRSLQEASQKELCESLEASVRCAYHETALPFESQGWRELFDPGDKKKREKWDRDLLTLFYLLKDPVAFPWAYGGLFLKPGERNGTNLPSLGIIPALAEGLAALVNNCNLLTLSSIQRLNNCADPFEKLLEEIDLVKGWEKGSALSLFSGTDFQAQWRVNRGISAAAAPSRQLPNLSPEKTVLPEKPRVNRVGVYPQSPRKISGSFLRGAERSEAAQERRRNALSEDEIREKILSLWPNGLNWEILKDLRDQARNGAADRIFNQMVYCGELVETYKKNPVADSAQLVSRVNPVIFKAVVEEVKPKPGEPVKPISLKSLAEEVFGEAEIDNPVLVWIVARALVKQNFIIIVEETED